MARWGRRRADQPPVELERRFELTGIAGNYKFPESLNRVMLQNRIWAHTGMARADAELAERVRAFGQSIRCKKITAERIRSEPKLSEAFERFCEDHRRIEITAIFEELAKANAEEISKIRFDRNDFWQLLDVVHGIVSGINSSDINFYLRRSSAEVLSTAACPKEERRRRDAESRVLKQLGIHDRRTLGWIVSMETLEKLLEQTRSRHKHRPESSRQPNSL